MCKRCNMPYIVYKHTNLINGKIYFGITFQNPLERWGFKGKGYANNEHFYRDILMYGWDEGFSHEILHYNLTPSEASYYERKYIKEFNTQDKNYGYNIADGGVDSNDNYIEVKEVIDLKTGLIYPSIALCAMETDSARITIEADCKGRLHNQSIRQFMYYDEFCAYSEQEQLNLRKGLNADGTAHERTRTTEVVRLVDGKHYSSIDSCMKENKITQHTILNHCNGSIKGKKPRLYMYQREYTNLTPSEKNNYRDLIIEYQGRQIVCLYDGKVYPTYRQCQLATGAKPRTIKGHCSNFLKQSKDRLFMYIEEYDKLSDTEKELYKKTALEALEVKQVQSGKAKQVICLLDGTVHNSMQECADAYGLVYKTIKAHCSKKRNLEIQQYMFLEDYNNLSEEDRLLYAEKAKNKIASERNVVRIIDGKEYNTIKECAKDNDWYISSVLKHCYGIDRGRVVRIRRFMFLEDYKKLSNEEIKILQDKVKQKGDRVSKLRAKPVISIADKRIFKSALACSFEYNHGVGYIRNHCNNKYIPQKFMYLEDYEKIYGKIGE